MAHNGVSRVRLALATVLLSTVTAFGGAASTGAAAASPTAAPAAVEIVGQVARIGNRGSVAVRFRSRCLATYQAFELNVSVSQGATSGFVFKIGPPNVLVCDGRWRTTVVKVAPSVGKFRKGPAQVEVSVQYFDTAQGNDTAAGAGKQLRLVRC